MKIHLEAARPADLSVNTPSASQAGPNQELYSNSLTSGKDFPKRAKELASQYLDGFLSGLLTAWDYFVWIIQCCPNTSKFDIIEDIIENPIEEATTWAEKPIEFFALLIAAVLQDPAKVAEYIEKNQSKFDQFKVKFQELSKTNLLEAKEGLYDALHGILNIQPKSSKSFTSLVELLQKHVLVLDSILKSVQQKVLEAIGSETVENETPDVANLRIVFQEILPTILTKIKEDPDAGKVFIGNLYQYGLRDSVQVVNRLKQLVDLNSRQKAALEACCSDDYALFKKLRTANLLGLDKTVSVDLIMAFQQAAIAAAPELLVDELLELFGANFAFGTAILNQFKEMVATSPGQQKTLSDHFPKALEVLGKLK